jgi:hypothetical protein
MTSASQRLSSTDVIQLIRNIPLSDTRVLHGDVLYCTWGYNIEGEEE